MAHDLRQSMERHHGSHAVAEVARTPSGQSQANKRLIVWYTKHSAGFDVGTIGAWAMNVDHDAVACAAGSSWLYCS